MIAEDLATLRRNWSILHPTTPWPGVLFLWAPASTSARTLAPWLEQARRKSTPHARLLVVARATLRTRSLGAVEHDTYCWLPFELERSTGALPLSRLHDVGELARRAAAGSLGVDPTQ